MKKRMGIVLLCICFALMGCSQNDLTEASNTEDPNMSLAERLDVINAIHSIAPYDQLLPRQVLDGYILEEYILSDYSENAMTKYGWVSLSFRGSDGTNLSVSINAFDDEAEQEHCIADPNDPKTYDVSWYSQQDDPRPERYSFDGLFYAKDLTIELVEARIGNFVPGEGFSIDVGVICGDWKVQYRWNTYTMKLQELPVSAQQIFEMIMSSKYYTEGSSVVLGSGFSATLAESAAYSVSPFDRLFPREVLEGYEGLDVYIACTFGKISGHITLINDEGIKVEIDLREYKKDMDVIANPDDPKTYDMVWYSQNPRSSKFSLNGLFYADDLTEELIEARMGLFAPGEIFDFTTGVLCDDYVVSYYWYPTNKEYPNELPISAQEMYDMITSSRYFTE